MKSVIQRVEDGEITWTEYQGLNIKRREFKSISEYQNELAKKKGYIDYNDYHREKEYESGRQKSMYDNKNCSMYLGVHIAERILSKIWDNVIRMSIGNIGYDFICGKGFKVDVKSSCIVTSLREHELKSYEVHNWFFNIKKNKIADYFLLIAFDNREDLTPLHIWLIKGDKIVNKSKLNDKISLIIYTHLKSVNKLKEYEQTDKLEKMKKCCEELGEK